jgi:hypothetical protein
MQSTTFYLTHLEETKIWQPSYFSKKHVIDKMLPKASVTKGRNKPCPKFAVKAGAYPSETPLSSSLEWQGPVACTINM